MPKEINRRHQIKHFRDRYLRGRSLGEAEAHFNALTLTRGPDMAANYWPFEYSGPIRREDTEE